MFELRHLRLTYTEAGLDPTKKANKRRSNLIFYELITNGKLFIFNTDGIQSLRRKFQDLIRNLHLLYTDVENTKRLPPNQSFYNGDSLVVNLEDTQSSSHSLSLEIVVGDTKSPSEQSSRDHEANNHTKEPGVPPFNKPRSDGASSLNSDTDMISLTSSQEALSHTDEDRAYNATMEKLYKETKLNDTLEIGDAVWLPNNMPALINGWYHNDGQPHFVLDKSKSNGDFLQHIDFKQPRAETVIIKCASKVPHSKGGKILSYYSFKVKECDKWLTRALNSTDRQKETSSRMQDALGNYVTKCYITRPLLTAIENPESVTTITEDEFQTLEEHFTETKGKPSYGKAILKRQCCNSKTMCLGLRKIDTDTSPNRYYECRCNPKDQIIYCAECFGIYILGIYPSSNIRDMLTQAQVKLGICPSTIIERYVQRKAINVKSKTLTLNSTNSNPKKE